MNDEWDAVIIGGGTAGLSAAQMLGRSRRRTLVIDGGVPRNRFAAHMHGVLGHDGVDPAQLLEAGRAEARAYGVEIVQAEVTSLVDDGERIRVVRSDGGTESARAVVVATGVRDELLDVAGLLEEWGRTVLHCPYCHGWEVAGRRLAVLPTSPSSLVQVELVRQLSDDVTAFTAAAEPLDDDAAARFLARGIRIVRSGVRRVRREEGGLVLETEDGAEHHVGAVFTGGAPVLEIGFAADLALARTEAPGAPLAVDPQGTTSHPRVFAAGNATAPFGNVPVSMASGSTAGAGANAMLVAEDFALAVADRAIRRNDDWEQRYASMGSAWSGRVNEAVAAVVEGLRPGTVLDIGSGEGADVVWLAEHGWRATGVDVSPTAVQRAAQLARSRGVEVDVRVGDGAAAIDGLFDLVLASFLHSWEQDFPRLRMLHDAASRVAPDGRLLIVSHVSAPHGASEHGASEHAPAEHETAEPAPILRTPEEELALLALDPAMWRAEIVETRSRTATAPDGSPAHLEDGVLLLHRLA